MNLKSNAGIRSEGTAERPGVDERNGAYAMERSERVLVVDDDPDIANGTVRLLDQAGYHVRVVDTGEGAWRLIEDWIPDLVLLDRDLPDIDGLEVCRRVKRNPALESVLVVLVSACYVDSEDQSEGLEVGADGYIARPIANRELLARVHAFMRIVKLTSLLRGQSVALKSATEASVQAQVATLNLLEDALENQQRAERAQLELTHSKQMLEATGALAQVGGWELDLITNKLTWTREAFRIAGLEPPEPSLEDAIKMYAPESQPLIIAAVEHVKATGESADLELRMFNARGEERWMRTKVQGDQQDGRTIRLYGIFKDITARRQEQAALVASEARARAIIEASPVPMGLIDADDRISFINPACKAAFGFDVACIPHLKDLWRIIFPDPNQRRSAYDAWHSEMDRSRATGEAFRPMELQICCFDGSQRSVLASSTDLMTVSGRSRLVTMQDITLRKRMEKQVLQSEKLASIGLLAAGVAHEINNPIGFVSSNLSTLKRNVSELLAVIDAYEAVQETGVLASHHWGRVDDIKDRVELDYLRSDLPQLLADSDEGLQRVRRIVQGLKTFARTSAVDTWQSDDLIAGLESTLNVIWNELKYTCEIRKEYSPLPLVECVLAQINQVFMNLLVNAAQAIKDRGVITLRTGHSQEEVWIEIRDTGCGISVADQAQIFDPFFTTKDVGKGTGLGLSVSHGIIERHHGRIEVESEVGRGSTFRVHLPIRQPQLQGAEMPD